MRVPIRKAGDYQNLKADSYLTQDKFLELQNKLQKLKEITRPKWIKEMRVAASDGDFSENASYQIAKAKLRGTNQKIDDLEYLISRAQIIPARQNNNIVRLGHKVVLLKGQEKFVFHILGATETNPDLGIISFSSPLGQALMGKKVGDTIKVDLADRELEYKLVEIK
jgi:transcription elongation factor GreA